MGSGHKDASCNQSENETMGVYGKITNYNRQVADNLKNWRFESYNTAEISGGIWCGGKLESVEKVAYLPFVTNTCRSTITPLEI